MNLEGWLRHNESQIAVRWFQELRSGVEGGSDEGTKLLESMVNHLVSFLPPCFGMQRDLGMDVWQQAAHLYGSLAVRRGLAAGEVVEELQLLRNVILRLFLLDAPSPLEGSNENAGPAGRGILPLELLTLNRLLDMGVSRASIAYVDDLFFAHLQGSGVPEGITSELVEETERQLLGFEEELRNRSGAGKTSETGETHGLGGG